MSSAYMLCLVFIIIAPQSIRACPRSPPLGNQSMWVNGIFSSSLKNPNYFIGILCFGCEFDSNDLQHNIEHPSKGMPNCAYDYLYDFGEEAQNVSWTFCNSCVKANVYLKGNTFYLLTTPLSQAFETQVGNHWRYAAAMKICTSTT